MKSIQLSLAVAAVASVAIAVGVAGTRNDATTGDPQSTPTLRSRTIPPTVSNPLVASPARLSLIADAGTAMTTVVSVTHNGGGHLDVVPDGAVFGSPVVTPLGGGAFSVALTTSDVMPEGAYRGLLRVRLCATSSCTSVIASTTVPYTLGLKWANPGEWGTFQRDAGHRGYVPVVIDIAKIRKVWEWQTPTQSFFNPVATGQGRVFISEGLGFSNSLGKLYSLRESDGSQLWLQEFAVSYAKMNAPATSGDTVYVASSGQGQTFLFSLRQADGGSLFQSAFTTQWGSFLAPTVADGLVYQAGGTYGGGTYAYDAEDGTPLWTAFQGDDDMSTPAVEDGKVYHYDDASGLRVYDAVDGTPLATIADPVPYNWHTYSYGAAPMLGAPDHVFALSSNDSYNGRYIVNYSPSTNASRWTSVRKYIGTPAYKDGVVYATSNNPKALDALDAVTGQRLWSWVPNPSDTSFQGNVVVTKNLAFVSTNVGLYAIDLATRQPVWSAPTPGNVAISGDGTLYLVTVPTQQGPQPVPKLLAYRLR